MRPALDKGWLWQFSELGYQFLHETSEHLDAYCHDDYDFPFLQEAPADLDWCVGRITALETALREIRDKLAYAPYGLQGPTLPEIAAVVSEVKAIADCALEGDG